MRVGRGQQGRYEFGARASEECQCTWLYYMLVSICLLLYACFYLFVSVGILPYLVFSSCSVLAYCAYMFPFRLSAAHSCDLYYIYRMFDLAPLPVRIACPASATELFVRFPIEGKGVGIYPTDMKPGFPE